jgi:hypothetical protein
MSISYFVFQLVSFLFCQLVTFFEASSSKGGVMSGTNRIILGRLASRPKAGS